MENNELYLKQTGIIITHRCTLRCRLCSAYSPYYAPAPHYSADYLMETITRYFGVVDKVWKFTIVGGEPFIHPELPEIIDFFDNFDKQIDILEVITNGTIAPNERLLESLGHSERIDILVDDYGQELSTKIPRIQSLFESNGIKHRIRKYHGEDAHMGGWIDFSSFEKSSRTDIGNQELFNRCISRHKNKCFNINDGKAYLCPVYKRCCDLNIIDENPNECFNFFDDSLSISEKKSKISRLMNIDYLSSCAYCNGFDETSKRYKPAEQIV